MLQTWLICLTCLTGPIIVTMPSRSRTRRAVAAAASPPRARPRNKAEATTRLLEATRALVDRLPARELQELALSAESAVAPSGQESAGRSVLTGEALPSVAEVGAARWRNTQRAFAERRRLLAETISVGEVAQLLGVTRQTPHDRLRAGTLVGVKDHGQWRFPLWQFDADGPDGTLPGLPEVLSALRGPLSPYGRLRWFDAPKELLAGRTPVETLRAGDVDATVEAAQALGAS